MFNEDAGEMGDAPAVKPSLRTRMTLDQMKLEREDRENKMKHGSTKKETDQWRVYQHIVSSIEKRLLLLVCFCWLPFVEFANTYFFTAFLSKATLATTFSYKAKYHVRYAYDKS